MDCSSARTTISARLDGEALPGGDLDGHLSQCADCRAFAADAARLHRAVRVAPAPEVPDLTPRILAAIAAEPVRRSGTEPVRRSGTEPARRWEWVAAAGQEQALRVLLVAIALVQIGVALPALLLGSDAGLPVHTARHLGSFDVAIGVGFLFAAWKPERIPGILPVVAALVVCLLGTSLLDVLDGATGASGEAHHAADFAGLAVVWLLSRAGARARPGGRAPEPATRGVQVA